MDASTLFTLSLFDIDKSISTSEFKDILIKKTQPIVEKEFANNREKQKIRSYHDRIAIACPYCGDSAKNFHAKRGNLILAGKHIGYYKCHNCGIFKKIENFFKDFNVTMDLEVINYLSSVVHDYEHNQHIKYDMLNLLNLDSLEKYAIDREEFKSFFGYKEVTECTILSWLNNRMQYDYKKFLMDVNENKLIILNLTKNGKIVGIQKRLFAGANKFETYKLKKILEIMKKPIDENDDWEYIDTMSTLFNICFVDFNRPITVLEGPMDSFLLKNSIANTGANKMLPLDIEVRYWYDYDETGIKKSIEYIQKNKQVFLWSKLIQEYELPNRKKWDLNDFIIYAKVHQIKIPNFSKYYSSDPLDILDI